MRATGSAHEHELIFRFDAFGNGIDAETSAETRHRRHDRRAVVDLGEFMHEGPINLYLVEWKHAQIAQRGIPGPEIVEHDGNAQKAELVQPLDNIALQEDRFRNLDLQTFRR